MQAQMETPVTKDPKLWMDDGNVIVRTATDQGQHLFKCHKSVLASHSTIYADLFSVPQTSQSSEKFEGIDVVDFPDGHEDVRNLLYLMYDPGQWLQHPQSTRVDDAHFRSICGILRLATKYEMTTLRTSMITQLEAAWPADLAEWNRKDQLAIEEEFRSDWPIEGPFIEYYYPDPVLTINIAEEFNVGDRVLPVAYYHLSRIHPGELVDDAHASAQLHRRNELTGMQCTRLIIGRDSLRTSLLLWARRLAISRVPQKGETACVDHANADWPCKVAFREWWKTKVILSDLFDTTDPLAELGTLTRTVRLPESAMDTYPCTGCFNWAARLIEEERASIWNELPKWFLFEQPEF